MSALGRYDTKHQKKKQTKNNLFGVILWCLAGISKDVYIVVHVRIDCGI